MRGKGQYWEAQNKLFEVYSKRLGFNEHRVGSERHTRVNTFRRPTAQALYLDNGARTSCPQRAQRAQPLKHQSICPEKTPLNPTSVSASIANPRLTWQNIGALRRRRTGFHAHVQCRLSLLQH